MALRKHLTGLFGQPHKLKDWLGSAESSANPAAEAATLLPVTNIVADAEGALIALGYKPQDASRMVVAVNDDSIRSSEDLIRRALKSMVKR